MIVLAVEPDPRLAATVRHVVCDLVRAELELVASVELAVEVLQTETPDLILLPALVSPADEGTLLAALRSRPECSHIDMLITPAFEEEPETVAPRGWRRWRSRRPVNGSRGVDERKLFAERLGWSLVRARQQRAQTAPSPPAAESSQPDAESVEGQANQVVTTALVPLSVASPPPAQALILREPSPSIVRGFETNRRASPRYLASELRGLREARIRFGPEVSLVDVSMGGALIETDTRLQPDSEAVLEIVGNLHRAVPFRVVRSQATIADGALRYRGACAFTQSIDVADLLETCLTAPNLVSSDRSDTDDVLELLERQLPSLRREQLVKLLSVLRSGQPPANALEREALDLLNFALSALKPGVAPAVQAPVIEPPASHGDPALQAPEGPDDPSNRRRHLRVYGPFDGLRLGAIETPLTIRDSQRGRMLRRLSRRRESGTSPLDRTAGAWRRLDHDDGRSRPRSTRLRIRSAVRRHP